MRTTLGVPPEWAPDMRGRVIVTGWRDWPDKDAVVRALNHINEIAHPGVIVHGGRGNVDLAAHAWARQNGWQPEPRPADWKRYKRGAGPIRNAEMVAAGADLCIAFTAYESKGAAGCAKLARDAGIPVWEISL